MTSAVRVNIGVGVNAEDRGFHRGNISRLKYANPGEALEAVVEDGVLECEVRVDNYLGGVHITLGKHFNLK